MAKIKKIKNKMTGQISLIIALMIEGILLILIFLVMIVGVMGVFLPFLPGLFIFGLAAGLYSLLVRKGYGKLTPKINIQVVKFGNYFKELSITKKIMAKINIFKTQRQERNKEEILKHGLILSGFNLALILIFLFGFIGLTMILRIIAWQGLILAFVPLLFLFIFAGASAIIWYRFGQLLGKRFKNHKIINTSFVVLISVLPILAIILLSSALMGLVGGFVNELLVLAFLGFLLMAVLAAVFELLVVSLGVITTVQ